MWARPGYREINPGAAGILNNEQLPSVLSRAETKTWFRDTQIELLSLFKPSLSSRAVSCCSQSREGWKFSNAKLFKCPDSWHGVLGPHLLPGPHGTKTMPEVRPQAWKACPRPSTKRKATGVYHERAVRTHQAYSQLILNSKPPLEHNIQSLGHGPFVGHETSNMLKNEIE